MFHEDKKISRQELGQLLYFGSHQQRQRDGRTDGRTGRAAIIARQGKAKNVSGQYGEAQKRNNAETHT
jgi:hypothetical protein